MLTRTEYLLVQLASEACEVAHRATKALHFGLEEKQPGQDLTNTQRLIGEFTDLLATAKMLCDEAQTELDLPSVEEAIVNKITKVEDYMRYARKLGTLEPEA